MSDIFISYRREDSAGDTRSIRDRLSGAFAGRQVFMDVDAIPIGVDFREYLLTSIRKCRVFLVIIGPGWLDAKDAAGRRRLDNSQDFVRAEIEIALQRESKKELRVIPVLLNEAKMPAEEKLPALLKPLAFRNAINIRHGSFERDVAELVTNVRHDIQPVEKAGGQGTLRPRTYMIAGVLGLVAVAALGFALLATNSDRTSPQRAADRLTLKLDAGELTGARQLADELLAVEPELSDSEDFRAALQRLASSEAEAKRRYEFGQLYSKLSEARPENVADEAIERLIALASTREEQDRAAEVQNKRGGAIERVHRMHNEAVSAQLASARDEIGRLRSKGAGTQKEVVSTLEKLRDSLTKVGADKDTSAQVQAEAQSLLQQTQSLLASTSVHAAAPQTEPAITKGVGDLVAYRAALDEFVQTYPASASAAAFRQVTVEAPLWESIQGWSGVLNREDFLKMRSLGTEQARKCSLLLTQGEDKFGLLPIADARKKLLGFLSAIGSRLDHQHQSIVEQLKAELTGADAMRPLWMMELADGNRYYGQGARPKPNADGLVKVNVETSLGGKTPPRPLRIEREKVKYISDESPALLVYTQIVQTLSEKEQDLSTSGRWEEMFCELLKTIREKPHLDPIVAVGLYRRLLEVAALGSYPIQLAFQKDRDILSNARVNTTVNWIDPDDPAANKARRVAIQTLAALGKPAEQKQAVLKETTELAKLAAPKIAWVGWLGRDGKGAWRPYGLDLKKASDVYVAQKAENHLGDKRPSGELRLIGTIDGREPRWKDSPALFVEGRPLYTIENAGGAQTAAAGRKPSPAPN